ncbi:MAG: hypothetical protein HQ536_05235 [Parcubacteria group bacterium]|nr:hypothetical protein [Parcubacteria group bacterium]
MILAIGNSGVYEVDAFRLVVEELKSRGEKAILFKQDKCLDGEFLIFEIINGNPEYKVIVDNDAYNIRDFSAIWYMKPHLPFELLRFDPAEYRNFINSQFRSMRVALWSLFKEKKWLDNPWNIEKAENKIFQLEVAIKVGFQVPDTIITSDPDRVKYFYHIHNKNIIVKLLHPSPMLDKVVYTNKVSESDLKRIETLKMSPSIFQECVDKKYELRVTFVGNKIFAAKIHSQKDIDTSLDWRRQPKLNDFKVEMEPTTLPANIEAKIRAYMNAMNLRFGCIDMIVDKNGDYIFLEINPNGQWYFIQLQTKQQISKAIADLLV